MSRVTEKSPKHCAAKQSPPTSHSLKPFLYLSSLLLTLLSFLLLLWLILKPAKPQFSVSRADVAPNSTTIRLAVRSHNPNTKLGIYYDEISARARHEGREIGGEIAIAPFYQDGGGTDTLTASLAADDRFGEDLKSGKLVVRFEMIGKLRWGSGYWKSGEHGFSVRCDAFVMPFGAVFSAGLYAGGATECSTQV